MRDWTSYDDVADAYARVHAPRLREPARALVEMVEIRNGEHVVDVGTGTGIAAGIAAESGARVVGVDASVGMLSEARRMEPELQLAAAEAIDLPFRDGTFDAVTVSFVLAHFARTETALYDLVRVTKPGGRHGYTSWGDTIDAFVETWLELVDEVVPRAMLAPTLDRAIPNHERFRRPAEIEEVLYDAGLRRVRVERRPYEWTYDRDEYVDGIACWATGRFVRSMLGEAGWDGFMQKAHATFAERFPDPLHDRREVLFAIGTKG